MSAEGERTRPDAGNRPSRREFRKQILDRLDVLRVEALDILVLHIPKEVIMDQGPGGLFEQAQAGAVEVMEAARRPVILLPEGTELTAESVRPFLKELGVEASKPQSRIHLPGPGIELP